MYRLLADDVWWDVSDNVCVQCARQDWTVGHESTGRRALNSVMTLCRLVSRIMSGVTASSYEAGEGDAK
jgi:hypothetical protein